MCRDGNAHQKKQIRKNGRKSTEQGAKGAVRGMEKVAKNVSKIIVSAVHAVAGNPVVWIVLLVIVLIGAVAGVVDMVISSGGAATAGTVPLIRHRCRSRQRVTESWSRDIVKSTALMTMWIYVLQ